MHIYSELNHNIITELEIEDRVTVTRLNLSSEDRLLLYCSRLSISEDIKYKIEEILSNELDWNYIIDCSIKQGISPLLYWNLKKINIKNIPSEAIYKLEKMYYNTLARNMIRYQELHKVLTAFKKAGIDVIVLKGAFLAEKIYKNIGLRPMSDIDLLIKQKDLRLAETELTKLMYFSINLFPTRLHEQLHLVRSGEITFVSQNKSIAIDIHWDVQPYEYMYKVNVDEFWSNTKPTKIADIEILTFACENLLQHLCLHVDKHITLSNTYIYAPPAKPLRDYCDIAEVINYYKSSINWNYLLQKSKDYKIEGPVYQGLSIAKKHFGAFVPENVLITLKPIKPTSIDFEDIYKEAMKDRHEKEDQWDKITYFMNLKMADGYCNKIRIILGYIFPSKEFMIYHYSIRDKEQLYVYYLIRLGKGLQYGLNILRQLPRYLLE